MTCWNITQWPIHWQNIFMIHPWQHIITSMPFWKVKALASSAQCKRLRLRRVGSECVSLSPGAGFQGSGEGGGQEKQEKQEILKYLYFFAPPPEASSGTPWHPKGTGSPRVQFGLALRCRPGAFGVLELASRGHQGSEGQEEQKKSMSMFSCFFEPPPHSWKPAPGLRMA